MNTDKETKQRFKRKLLNATTELDGLVAFIQVHNEDDDSKAFRRGNEMQDELEHFAKRLAAMFDKANSK